MNVSRNHNTLNVIKHAYIPPVARKLITPVQYLLRTRDFVFHFLSDLLPACIISIGSTVVFREQVDTICILSMHTLDSDVYNFFQPCPLRPLLHASPITYVHPLASKYPAVFIPILPPPSQRHSYICSSSHALSFLARHSVYIPDAPSHPPSPSISHSHSPIPEGLTHHTFWKRFRLPRTTI
ncbi:hypothetical protein PTI98_006583 [Pleurotus ostreatus]|nr:hypothetical protein PTI98_006583 [Pleurotus ostreatus]